MINLEQVKLLESKVVKALDYIKLLSEENSLLREKLDGYRIRIDELELLIKAFRDDQGRIEASILSALDRLNQFDDAIEQGLARAEAEAATTKSAEPEPAKQPQSSRQSTKSAVEPETTANDLEAEPQQPATTTPELPDDSQSPSDDQSNNELDIF